ncbi:MAG: ribulose-phosphate 3-epimerase [Bacteroidetes bacterium]|nr:MAG: ribulose-phosphate 3-epimerase [Bacteroidota bacterium]
MSHLIAPSLLAADFANLQRDVEMINSSEADWFHVDVMDGVFVPNISFGFPSVAAVAKHAKKPLDVHLMIVNPDQYIDKYAELGVLNLTVHSEACTHLHRTIQAIHGAGMEAGVALNPHTNINVLDDIINDLDLVCIMSVNPGFGGQKFIENTYAKVRALKVLISEHGSNAKIEIDGGVGLGNAQDLLAAGADVLVAGSAIFGTDDPVQTAREMKAVSFVEA